MSCRSGDIAAGTDGGSDEMPQYPANWTPGDEQQFRHPNLIVNGEDTRTGTPAMQSPDIATALLLMSRNLRMH